MFDFKIKKRSFKKVNPSSVIASASLNLTVGNIIELTFTATSTSTILQVYGQSSDTTRHFFIDNTTLVKIGAGGPSEFEPVVATISNYYPFGSPMPNRSFSSGDYRYGFNGKESDNEVSGNGNSYDYGFRIYNPRIGKFLSVDPLFQSYPWYTPYQFAGNMPIAAIDLDGLEEFVVIRWYDSDDKYVGSTIFRIENENDRLQETGTLIVNQNKNDQSNFNSDINKQFKDKLFNVNESGKPISLKGGKILNESPNQLERNKVVQVDPKQTDVPKASVFIKYGKTDVPFVTPDNTTPVNETMIDNLKNALSVNPEYGIEVIGHASQEPNDNASAEHNLQLSEKRAKVIGDQIIKSGIPADKVSTSGVGTSQPKYSNDTETGRQKNRRASIGLTVPKNKNYD